MTQWREFTIETEGTGISEPLSEQINLLGTILGHVIRTHAGQSIFDLVEELRNLCKEAAVNEDEALRDEAARKIGQLDLNEMVWILRAFTDFFHLVNKAEQLEIIRINRERAHAADADHPRPESIAESIGELKKQGYTLDQVMDILNRLDIQPTLTAHPTEARRQTILHKQHTGRGMKITPPPSARRHLHGRQATPWASAAAGAWPLLLSQVVESHAMMN